MWWAMICVPYPVGWLLGLVFGAKTLIHAFRHPVGPPYAA